MQNQNSTHCFRIQAGYGIPHYPQVMHFEIGNGWKYPIVAEKDKALFFIILKSNLYHISPYISYKYTHVPDVLPPIFHYVFQCKQTFLKEVIQSLSCADFR